MSKRKATSSEAESKDAAVARTEDLQYMFGYNNEFESESLPDALPHTTTPKKCPYGLYAEQLNGTAFTVPRHHQRRSWLYRIKPACVHNPFKPYPKPTLITADFSASNTISTPAQMRWRPFAFAEGPADFVDGMKTLGGAGSAELKNGIAIHIYSANQSMGNRAFVNSDGDFLVVPQKGHLRVVTEFGLLDVSPGEIFVIPRGIRFKVLIRAPPPDPNSPQAPDTNIRGYICEIFHGHYEIPDLGPIGANGLAHARDFKAPVAHAEESTGSYEIVYKFLGELSVLTQDHTPFDVVAWRGNYVPYKYNLDDFVPLNAVVRDHIDPSIFTVLTAQSLAPGVAVADFVIFPPRWAVQQDTFRPPYYHRNCMSEFMGNIRGHYEAKPHGFSPGSASLHSCMAGHGPDAETFEKATNGKEDPVFMAANDLAFMFESTFILRLTKWAMQAEKDEEYNSCWDGLESHFHA